MANGPPIQRQPFRPSASRERQITQVLQQRRQAAAGAQGQQFVQQDYSFIYARIPASATVATIKPFEAVYFDGADPVTPNAGTNIHLAQRIANGYHYTEPSETFRQWGIALDTITKTDAGRVLVSGVSWLDTTSVSPLESDATHFNLIDGQLVCGYNGRATILQVPTQPHCLVELAERRSILLGKTKEEGLDPDVEGEVFYVAQSATGWEDTTITLKAWPANRRILKERLVVLLPTEGKYIAIDADQSQLRRFTLTSVLGDESEADATIDSTGLDNGDEIQVTRWNPDHVGEIGDKGIAWYDGETHWILTLQDSKRDRLVRFTLASHMRDESFADATINSSEPDNGDEIQVTRWSDSSEGDVGDKGIAWWDGDTSWVIELGTPVRETISFEATSTPAYGTFNTPQTFSALVTVAADPDLVGETVDIVTTGRTRVKTGMRGSAFLDFNEIWTAIELQQPAAELLATLSADLLPADTTATAVTVDSSTTAFPADVLPTGATITAQNVLRLHGFDQAKVLLRYDAANDNYFIAQVYGYADRIVGSITSDFDSAADEVDMGSLVGLNGLLSPALVTAGSATVQNTHSWEGKAGGRARAEYNWTAEQWEFYQIDCAEEQGSPPGSGPGLGDDSGGSE
jgi:hypothetical protein